MVRTLVNFHTMGEELGNTPDVTNDTEFNDIDTLPEYGDLSKVSTPKYDILPDDEILFYSEEPAEQGISHSNGSNTVSVEAITEAINILLSLHEQGKGTAGWNKALPDSDHLGSCHENLHQNDPVADDDGTADGVGVAEPHRRKPLEKSGRNVKTTTISKPLESENKKTMTKNATGTEGSASSEKKNSSGNIQPKKQAHHEAPTCSVLKDVCNQEKPHGEDRASSGSGQHRGKPLEKSGRNVKKTTISKPLESENKKTVTKNATGTEGSASSEKKNSSQNIQPKKGKKNTKRMKTENELNTDVAKKENTKNKKAHNSLQSSMTDEPLRRAKTIHALLQEIKSIPERKKAKQKVDEILHRYSQPVANTGLNNLRKYIENFSESS